MGVLGPTEKSPFLIIARSHLRKPASVATLPTELLDRLVLYGALATLDGVEPVGIALAVQAPDREAVDALIEDERTGLGAFSEIEVHNWEFGGRRWERTATARSASNRIEAPS